MTVGAKVRGLLSFLAACLSLTATAGLACDEDSVDYIGADGKVVVTATSGTFRVDAGDEAVAATWMPGADILVCDDQEIVNIDDRETIAVTLIR
ncbi:MAG TPA: hypothetical protein VNZ94_00370 [Xanthobacteraceae bacterium]|nr:hypothetical protein [Xanthobacteraceae bacterium]